MTYIPTHVPTTPIAPIQMIVAAPELCPIGPSQGPSHPHCIPNTKPTVLAAWMADRDPRGPSIPKCSEHGPNLPNCSLYAFVDGRYMPPIQL
jgi:hypothetical protein